MKWHARDADAAAGAGAPARLAGGLRAVPRRRRCSTQAGRCMDCGIPFCNNGCPLGNLIPDWNDLVYRDHWRERDRAPARDEQLPRVHRPAVPGAVRGGVRARHQPGPGHDQAGRGRDRRPRLGRGLGRAACRPTVQTGKRVAVVGSGPAGLAAAQQLDARRARRRRVRARRPHRRAAALRHPRVQDGEAVTSTAASSRCRPRAPSSVPNVERRRRRHGRRAARGVRRDRARRRRDGVARPADPRARARRASTRRWSTCRSANRVQEGDLDEPPITASGKHVVIIGGGDTGADCLGTAHRQGAASVHQFEILPAPARRACADTTRGRRGR